MSKNSMAELVNKVSSNKGRSDRSKEYAKASEWPKCYIAGCPLQTTIKAENNTCGHHFKQFGFEAECTTEAIKEFISYIKKYNEMIFWNVRTWRERESQILGWPVLPATREEMDRPTMYLLRFKEFIDKGIKNKSEEIYSATQQ